MASSYLEVGSVGLTNLKDDLTKLAHSLHEVFELMNADMTQVGNAWRDGKYEEFVSGYRPQINKCEEISQRYLEWCKRVLEPAIEECIAIETTDVGGDGGGSIGMSGAGAADSGSGVVNEGKNRGFNLGTSGGTSQKAEKMREATERVKELTRKKLFPKPDDGGFDTPQNERKFSPIQKNMLFNGRQR